MKFNFLLFIKKYSPIFLILTALIFSCKKKLTKEEVYRIGIDKCDVQAPFFKKTGLNTKRLAYTTILKNITGVALVEIPSNPSDTANLKIYQHESWKKLGMMGSLTTGREGYQYTVPIPFVNTLGRSQSQMNKIYRIEPKNGVMEEFCTLPKADSTAGTVPFGVLGIYFDCHSNKVFASSVAGSTMEKQNGVIYSIDPKTGKIADQLKGYDAFGIFVCGISGEKILYFGSARNSNIYGIELDAEGNFIGDPEIKFTLDNLGPRGDDKARRIRLDKNNNLEINGIEFNYNLTANSQTTNVRYRFEYDENSKKWIFRNVYE